MFTQMFNNPVPQMPNAPTEESGGGGLTGNSMYVDISTVNGNSKNLAAWNAAVDIFNGGGYKGIYLPAGSYNFDGAVVPLNCEVIGAGMGRTVIVKGDNETATRPLTCTAVAVPGTDNSGITLRDFTIDGNYANNLSSYIAILAIDNADHALVERVEIKSYIYMAIEAPANRARISKCVIRGVGNLDTTAASGYGIWIDNGGGPNFFDIIIEDCYIENTRVNGIFANCDDLIIKNTTLFSCHTQISPTGGGQISTGPNTLIEGCYLDGNGNAATTGLELNDYSKVIGCTILNHGRYGIILQAGSKYLIGYNHIIDNNVTNVARDAGIAISDGIGDVIIANNYIGSLMNSDTLYGISIGVGCTEIVIVNNDLIGAAIAPILNSDSGSYELIVRGNTGVPDGNPLKGFSDASGDVQLDGLYNDYGCVNLTGPVNVYLPEFVYIGMRIRIYDARGVVMSGQELTISDFPGRTPSPLFINGGMTLVMNKQYGWADFIYDGGKWVALGFYTP